MDNQETAGETEIAADAAAPAAVVEGTSTELPPAAETKLEELAAPKLESAEAPLITKTGDDGVERCTPTKWAELKGILPQGDPRRPWIEPVSKDFRYHPADVLHGWSNHAYHFQAEKDALLLTEKDFEAALEAAAGFPACNAHVPAVAPAAPFRAEILKRAEAEAKAAEALKAAESKDNT